MKSLKIAVVVCSLFTAAAAYAQTNASTANAPQATAQTSSASVAAKPTGRDAATPARKTDDCVGPVSFCNVYFGS